MKRPIFVATIALISGIIIGVYLQKSIPIFFIIAILFLIINSIIKINIHKKCNLIITFFVIMIISSLYTYYLNNKYDKKYAVLNKSQIKVLGTITSNSEEKEYKYIYTLKVKSINDNKKYNGDIVIIYIKKQCLKDELKYGDEICIYGTYEEPSVSRNYKGFNYKNYLKSKKIYGIINIDNSNINVVRSNNLNIIDIISNNIFLKLKENLCRTLSNRTANLEIGILLGYSNNIDNDIQESFKDSNLTHMLAVSGENTMYVILMLNAILNVKIFGNKFKKIFTIIIIYIFVKITGSTLSVVRAGITCIIYMIASLTYRKADFITTISIASLLTMLENPFNIFNVGMQLSYAGTISIVLFYNVIQNKFNISNKILRYIFESLCLTFSANIFIIPIMIYNFNTISLTFLFSNLLVGPLIGIATMLGIILIVVSFISIKLSNLPAFLLDVLLKLIIFVAKFFANIKISKIIVTTPNIIFIIFIYILEIILFLILYEHKKALNIYKKINKKLMYKVISCGLIILLIFKFIIIIQVSSNLKIHFIDQTTPIMIQRLSHLFARKPLFLMEI